LHGSSWRSRNVSHYWCRCCRFKCYRCRFCCCSCCCCICCCPCCCCTYVYCCCTVVAVQVVDVVIVVVVIVLMLVLYGSWNFSRFFIGAVVVTYFYVPETFCNCFLTLNVAVDYQQSHFIEYQLLIIFNKNLKLLGFYIKCIFLRFWS
jgi:hypothetical protein